jgi:hypothetical protein
MHAKVLEARASSICQSMEAASIDAGLGWTDKTVSCGGQQRTVAQGICSASAAMCNTRNKAHSTARIGSAGACTYGGPCLIAMGRGLPYCPRQRAGGPETVQCLWDKGLNPMSSAASSSCRFGNTHVRSWMNCTSQSILQGRSHNGAASNGHLSAASPLPAVGLACKSAR